MFISNKKYRYFILHCFSKSKKLKGSELGAKQIWMKSMVDHGEGGELWYKNFIVNFDEVSRSCFVGVAWIFFTP